MDRSRMTPSDHRARRLVSLLCWPLKPSRRKRLILLARRVGLITDLTTEAMIAEHGLREA